MTRVKLQRRRGFTRLSGKRQVTLPLHVADVVLTGDASWGAISQRVRVVD